MLDRKNHGRWRDQCEGENVASENRTIDELSIHRSTELHIIVRLLRKGSLLGSVSAQYVLFTSTSAGRSVKRTK